MLGKSFPSCLNETASCTVSAKTCQHESRRPPPESSRHWSRVFKLGSSFSSIRTRNLEVSLMYARTRGGGLSEKKPLSASIVQTSTYAFRVPHTAPLSSRSRHADCKYFAAASSWSCSRY